MIGDVPNTLHNNNPYDYRAQPEIESVFLEKHSLHRRELTHNSTPIWP